MMRLKNIAVAAGAGLAAVLGPMAPAATADVVSDPLLFLVRTLTQACVCRPQCLTNG